jgi:hypothetical protein
MSLLPSTQDHLDFVDIRDDIVILKGGLYRIVIEATAINFDLLSEDEQNATIYAYATLVNSLEYPIQIVVRTRQIDITDYLNYLKNHLKEQPTVALREQLQDYIEFIQQLVLENTVLAKRFFVVVPYYLGGSAATASTQTSGVKPGAVAAKSTASKTATDDIVVKAKRELDQKMEELKWQFKRIGIQIRKLTTEELIRLYYEIYNPEAGKNHGVKEDVYGYTTGMVQSTLKQ